MTPFKHTYVGTVCKTHRRLSNGEEETCTEGILQCDTGRSGDRGRKKRQRKYALVIRPEQVGH